jgi:AraC-like DNA-binding protein
LVFSLSGALQIDVPAGDGVRSGTYGIPVGGLHTRPVMLPQSTISDGGPPAASAGQRGIQLAVHPFAARALFGMPAGELTGQVLELDDVIGRQGGALQERLTGSVDPGSAVVLVSQWIERRLAAASPGRPAAELQHAWRLIVSSGGRRLIGDVAREVGWSRRYLTARMQAEIGLGAKDLARVARFQLARSMVLTARAPLVRIAADCGYADQSHLTAEWREFAGCTPGQWIVEELPALTGHRHIA